MQQLATCVKDGKTAPSARRYITRALFMVLIAFRRTLSPICSPKRFIQLERILQTVRCEYIITVLGHWITLGVEQQHWHHSYMYLATWKLIAICLGNFTSANVKGLLQAPMQSFFVTSVAR